MATFVTVMSNHDILLQVIKIFFTQEHTLKVVQILGFQRLVPFICMGEDSLETGMFLERLEHVPGSHLTNVVRYLEISIKKACI